MGRKGLLLIVLALIIIGVGWFLLAGNKDNSKNNSSNSSQSQPAASDTSNTTNQPSQASATITYNGSLFSPSQVTIKQGDSVTVKNDSQSELDFESDPHPIHTDEPELNIGAVMPGQSQSFTVTKTGSWGYHNHLNSSQRGTIVVR